MDEGFYKRLTGPTYYGPGDIKKVLVSALDGPQINKNGKGDEYFSVPLAFDIETTSFEENDEKRATMYCWTMGINGDVIFGRTWGEWLECLEELKRHLHLSANRCAVIYVHNLAFEFQFIRKLFSWSSVFSTDERSPLYARTDDGIEFRCSYVLSGYKLEELANNLTTYKIAKLTGDLDYSLKRHTATEMTAKEIGYCLNDVRVVMAHIKECLETEKSITKIPLTKTGYVRRFCRKKCFSKETKINYRHIMEVLQITAAEYEQLQKAFAGGFTHANAIYSGNIMENVESFDFTSSYPAVLVANKFPMSRAVFRGEATEEQLQSYINKGLGCMFEITFTNLEPTDFEHPISIARSYNLKKVIDNNGRAVLADSLSTVVTELDYETYKRFYTWERAEIRELRTYIMDYLPKPLIEAILSLYEAKTKLKGVKGMEAEYQVAKGMLNAIYGMMVTNILQDDVIYASDMWSTEKADVEKCIYKYNNSTRRFLYYPWGVWCTAYARYNLFTGITEFGGDYLYSDTDSIKAINAEEHRDYIERYNIDITKKLEACLDIYELPHDLIHPKTTKGEEKPLGVWDDEGEYIRAKFIRAKCYVVEKKIDETHKTISTTIAGISKTKGILWLLDKAGVPYTLDKHNAPVIDITENTDGVFNLVTNQLSVDADGTGKLTHTYNDEEIRGVLKDYKNVTEEYHEYSSINLSPATYTLSLSERYVAYIMGLRVKEA